MKARITKRTVDSTKPSSKDVFVWDSETRGFGLKVTPEGRKVYLLQYRMGGRGFPTRRYTIGQHGDHTADEARDLAKELRRKISRGVDPLAEKASDKINTVKSLVTEFVKSRKALGRRSAERVEQDLNRDVVPKWGPRPAAEITKAEVIRLLDGFLNAGAGTKANRMLALLKTMFKWAEDRGVIKESPCKGLEKPSKENDRERTHADPELREIWNGAASIGWPFGPAFHLLILTGQRREEVGQMRRSELNLNAGLWTLPGDRTKNGQPHDIHLSPAAVAIIRDLPEITHPDTGKVADLIFTTTGKTPVSGWGRAKERLDEKILEARREDVRTEGGDPDDAQPMPHWQTHDLRRTFTTGLNNLGVLPHVADRIINHVARKKGGVMAVYNRAQYWEERKAAMSLWADYVETLTRTPSEATRDNSEGGANS